MAKRKAKKPVPKRTKKRPRRLGSLAIVDPMGTSVETVIYSDGKAVPDGGKPYRLTAEKLTRYRLLIRTK